MRLFSRAISLVFHPVFLNFYVVVLFLFVHPYTASKMNMNARLLHMAILIVNMVILPLLLMLFLEKRKIITSLQLPLREERGMVFLMLFVLFGITAYQMFEQEFSYLLVSYLAAISLGLLILYFINLKTKISMHAVAASSVVGAFVYLMFFESNNNYLYYLCFFILLSGLIGSARLYLKAHSPRQIWLGYTTGFLITITVLWTITQVLF